MIWIVIFNKFMENQIPNNKIDVKHVILAIFIIVTFIVSTVSLIVLLVDSDESSPAEDEIVAVNEGDVVADEAEEFESLLFEKSYYDLPFGAAEVEGYYTTVGRATSLDGSTPEMTCAAFIVTDGPDLLIDALDENMDMFGKSRVVVLGDIGQYPGADFLQSTEQDPARIVVTLNPIFEGSLVNCMPWPFNEVIELD